MCVGNEMKALNLIEKQTNLRCLNNNNNDNDNNNNDNNNDNDFIFL